MRVNETAFRDVNLIEPAVLEDSRSFSIGSWNTRTFVTTGIAAVFALDNHSYSARDIPRGLHFQTQSAQGNVVHVVAGADVAAGLMDSAPTFGSGSPSNYLPRTGGNPVPAELRAWAS